jgi:hypothetical protein
LLRSHRGPLRLFSAGKLPLVRLSNHGSLALHRLPLCRLSNRGGLALQQSLAQFLGFHLLLRLLGEPCSRSLEVRHTHAEILGAVHHASRRCTIRREDGCGNGREARRRRCGLDSAMLPPHVKGRGASF